MGSLGLYQLHEKMRVSIIGLFRIRGDFVNEESPNLLMSLENIVLLKFGPFPYKIIICKLLD